MGMEVLPPDVNESFAEFAVVKDSSGEGKDVIRFGLAAIKNVGVGPVNAILAAREEGGSFTSIEDFVRRVDAREINKKAIEALMKVGAFDSIGDRATLFANLDKIVIYMSKVQKNALSGQIDIFGSMGATEDVPSLPLDAPSEILGEREFLQWEKELLGLYLSSHPLREVEAWLREKTTPAVALKPGMDGEKVTVGGVITTVRKIVTKKGDAMAFVGLETIQGDIELIVFPRAYDATPDLWVADQLVVVQGKVNAKDRDGKTTEDIKVMADKAKKIDASVLKHYIATGEALVPELDPSAAQEAARIVITLQDLKDQVVLLRLKTVLQAAPGQTETMVQLASTGQKIRLPFKVAVSEKLKSQLADVVAEDALLVE
jgi:DNA polymerase-3 subunit alpha